MCTPSSYFCESGNVMHCSADGLSKFIYDTCTATEFCTAGDSTCNPQVCTPGQPACNGNVATTCNSNGSGYVAGGTNCGAQTCLNGVCQDALFSEDFEDGDFAGWLTAAGVYTRSVTSTVAANGTIESLLQTRTSSSGQYDGLYHSLTALTPTYISWWVRQSQTTSLGAYTILSGEARARTTSCGTTSTRVPRLAFTSRAAATSPRRTQRTPGTTSR